MIRFSSLARENLGVAQPLIQRLAQPIEVEKEVVNGDSPPLDIFAIAVAATLTLAFVAVLLVAGSLALEREENAFPRLTRSLVSPSALLAEKVVLGVAVGLVVTLLMLAGLQIFVPLHWSRFGLWLAAIVGGGAALGAAGAALGAAAREVRAVSLLAFMVTLPIAFLSLVPSGAVGKGVYDAIEIVVAVFPFKPALDAMTAALDPAGGSIGGPLLHLAILAVAYARARPPRPAPLLRGLSRVADPRVGSRACGSCSSATSWGARAARAAGGDAGAAGAPPARPGHRQRRELGRRGRDHREDGEGPLRRRRRRDHDRQPRLPPPRGLRLPRPHRPRDPARQLPAREPRPRPHRGRGRRPAGRA